MKKILSLVLVFFTLLSLFSCSANVTIKCPNCGADREGDSLFCGACGARFEMLAVCESCGHENDVKNKFCALCGSSLKKGGTSGNGVLGNNTGGNDAVIEQEIWLKTSEVTPNGLTTVFFYDSNGYLLATRASYTNTGKFYSISEYTNNINGQTERIQTTSARNNALGDYNSHYEATYHYDANGLLTSVTSHAGTRTDYAYDSEGRLISKTSGNSKTQYTYNENGTLSFEISCSGDVTNQKYEYYYDASGHLSKKVVSYIAGSTIAYIDDSTIAETTYMPIAVTTGSTIAETTYMPIAVTTGGTIAETTYMPIAVTTGSTIAETTYMPIAVTTGSTIAETTYMPIAVTTGSTIAETTASPISPNVGPIGEYNYIYDENGNLISMTEKDYRTGEMMTTTYEYLTLSQYCQAGKANRLPEEAGKFPDHIGLAGCDYCAGHGNDYCIGHICPSCNGQGSFTCRGCHGSGKGYMINGSNTCRVCYGSGKQICLNCDGAKKLFYN